MRLGGIGNVVADEIEQRTGFETRVTILGHVLRGGTPTAYDRVLATRFGIAAIDAVHDGDFGTMVALHGDRHRAGADRRRASRELKTVDRRAARDRRRLLRVSERRSGGSIGAVDGRARSTISSTCSSSSSSRSTCSGA